MELARKDQVEINFLDYLVVILKHKRLVWVVTFASALAGALISFLIAPRYTAHTRIYIPQQNNSNLAAIMAGSGAFGVTPGAGFGLKSQGELYAAMLKGDTISDRIIDRFGMMNILSEEYRMDAREDLKNMTDISVDRESDIVTIIFEDKDPRRAADVANAYVDELQRLTRGLAMTEASQRRLYFEEQLKETKAALDKADDQMRAFQEDTGALDMGEQEKAAIEGVASIKAQIAAKEVQLKAMRTYATEQNPQLRQAREELAGMKVELAKLESKGGRAPNPLMSTGRMPGVGADYAKKIREIKFNETLYELLKKQLEAAKLDEARDSVVIQKIDNAVPPDKKTKPKRRFIISLATFIGFIFAVFLAFLKEYFSNIKDVPEIRSKLDQMEGLIRLPAYRLKF